MTEYPEPIERLRAILEVLTTDFQDRTSLLVALAAVYPPSSESARRMFERDILTLERLGFLIVKLPKRPPEYRLAGWYPLNPERH